ncbi:4-alpha-glucanotransferase [Clostridia bacterium]|nr:4-alpha-glucanotransferase [Clostridia bacterium]
MHITSLPPAVSSSKVSAASAVGCLGQSAFDFVNWLAVAGQKYWQVLPLCPTGYGNSPYQSPCAFAGNPLLIDMYDLVARGLLTRIEVDNPPLREADLSAVYFDKAESAKNRLLAKAYERFSERVRIGALGDEQVQYAGFAAHNGHWLADYVLFAALKEENGDKPWYEWEDGVQHRDPSALSSARARLSERIGYYTFVQYTFDRQWHALKKYANSKGVQIVGDIPIYVAYDSSDVWAGREGYLLDSAGRPTHVAGVPPDYFCATGQLWGNPLYDWDKMRGDGYAWWLTRMSHALSLYDVVRIDHFRAFDTYYAVPADHKTAEHGEWRTGPRMDFWNTVFARLGNVPVIAEDLGEVFPSVRELLVQTGFPGMKVMQFGWNAEHSQNDHQPHTYEKNTAVYTGTHDNSTLLGWYRGSQSIIGGKNSAERKSHEKAAAMMKSYVHPGAFEHVVYASIRSLYASAADTVIVPMQDILLLDDRCRMNTPGTVGAHNWRFRMKSGDNTPSQAKWLSELARVYFR